MMSKRKFYKTIFHVTVLSETPLADGLRLEEVACEIATDCSSQMERTFEKLNARQVAVALIKQDSSPEFFQLNERGEDVL